MLEDVSDTALESLLGALERGRVQLPLSGTALSRLGVTELASHLAHLQAFDEATLPILLREVLRARRDRPKAPELVWTGPEGPAGSARSTGVVFRQLLASATRDVWMAGYSIDHGDRLFAPLFEAMRDRGVRARFLIHPKYKAGERRAPTVESGADLIINRFLEDNWDFGPPYPDIYYDPRPLERSPRASMHIKAVVVDDARVLIGSANFTYAGQQRNYEAGAYLESPDFARRLVNQLQSLIDAGHVLRYGAPGQGPKAGATR